MTLSDLVSEIFSDTKHRAVSLRQLSFLLTNLGSGPRLTDTLRITKLRSSIAERDIFKNIEILKCLKTKFCSAYTKFKRECQ